MKLNIWILVLAGAGMTNAQTWDRLADRFIDEAYLKYNPTIATQEGFHQFDTALEDFSQASRGEEIRTLRNFEREVTAFSGPARDRELVLSNIRSALLELESIRMWEKNADLYSGIASGAAFAIMSRKFAPPEKRLESLIARERRMPGLFAEARSNLKNPPRVYTEVAIEQLPGIIDFFEKDVPLAFRDVKDARLVNDFHASNGAVTERTAILPCVAQERSAAAVERRFSPGRGQLPEEAALRRDGGYSA